MSAASGSSRTASATAASPPNSRRSSASGQNVIPSPYGRQRPDSTVAVFPTSVPSSDASRDLPPPASATTVTRRQLRSSVAAVSSSRSIPSSLCRPTSGVSERRANASAPGTSPSTRHASTGALFPFASIGRHWLQLDRVPDEALGHRPDEDPAVGSGLLEPLGGVHRVAGDERRPLVAGDDDAGVDPDPQNEVAGRLLHRESGSHSAQCVVLVRLRQSEDRHHGVADELLHRAAVRLDGVAHRLVPRAHQLPQRLGVEPFSERGRTGKVAEEDADRLPRCSCGHHPRSVNLASAGIHPGYPAADVRRLLRTSSRARSATCAGAASSTRRRSRARCARCGSRCSRPTSTSRSSGSSSRTCASARSGRTSARA